jgi:hypothetical protein
MGKSHRFTSIRVFAGQRPRCASAAGVAQRVRQGWWACGGNGVEGECLQRRLNRVADCVKDVERSFGREFGRDDPESRL